MIIPEAVHPGLITRLQVLPATVAPAVLQAQEARAAATVAAAFQDQPGTNFFKKTGTAGNDSGGSCPYCIITY